MENTMAHLGIPIWQYGTGSSSGTADLSTALPPGIAVELSGAVKLMRVFLERKPHTWRLRVQHGRNSEYASGEMTKGAGIASLGSGSGGGEEELAGTAFFTSLWWAVGQ